MRAKSVSSLTYYVTDVAKTTAFYELLGLDIWKVLDDRTIMKSNWFTIDLIPAGDEHAVGAPGMLQNLAVDDVEAAHADCQKAGLSPTEICDGERKREFEIKDPDGYRIGVFQKK